MIERHGFDSLGLEHFYGSNGQTLTADFQRDLNEIFEGQLATYVPEAEDIRHLLGPFQKYVQQDGIRVYGIEDRTASLLSVAMNALNSCISSAELGIDDSVLHRILRGAEASDISFGPALDQHRSFFGLVKRKFPEAEIPHSTLDEMLLSRIRRDDAWTRFKQYQLCDASLGRRNEGMAQSIPARMRSIGSERSIVVVGYAHVDPGNERHEQDLHRLNPRLTNQHIQPLPQLLPYSVLSTGPQEYANAEQGR